MDLTRLHELRQKLLHDKVLAEVWSFFLEHFGEHVEFIALGERTRHPFVEAVLAQVAQQMFPQAIAIVDLILTAIPEQQLVHGGFSVDGRVGGVFYFEDAHVGLVAVSELPPGTETKYARFLGRPLLKSGEPSLN